MNVVDEPRAAIVRSTSRAFDETGDKARIVKARPIRLTRKMTVEEAFRVTVFECLAQVQANTPAIIHAREVEALHQMRVGLRRLHVALYAFGEEFRTPALKELRKRSKAFTDAIGPARDLDVFLGELFDEPASSGAHADAFATLRARAEKARREAWDKAVEHVSSAEFSVFLDDVSATAETHSWFNKAVRGTFKAHLAADAPVKPTAARMLDGHLIRVSKRGRHMKSLDDHDRHRLRIALKKLRYAAEFFEPLYKEKRVRRYLKRIRVLLDDLGALNDVVSVRGMLNGLIHEDGAKQLDCDVCFAAGMINGWHAARANRIGPRAVEHWERFKKIDPFWH
jgi:CHAD domain-containing protein